MVRKGDIGSMVLEKPLNGWINIHICDFVDRASYLTDVPIDILQSLIGAYKYHIPAAIKFDADGWEWILIIDNFDIHIISDGEDYADQFEYLHFEVDRDDFVQKIICNLLDNIDDWVVWCIDEDEDNAVTNRKTEILQLIEELKMLMKSQLENKLAPFENSKIEADCEVILCNYME